LKLEAREPSSERSLDDFVRTAPKSDPSARRSIKTPKTEGKHLLDRTFMLHRDDVWDYRMKVQAGAVLNVELTSSSPVDLFLVDEWHFSREDYEHTIDEEADTLEAKFRVECSKDTYYLTVVNEGQRNARVRIEAWLES